VNYNMKKALNLGLFLGLISVTSFVLQSCNEDGNKKTGAAPVSTVDSTKAIDDIDKDTVVENMKKVVS
jgi:hypothetical protein